MKRIDGRGANELRPVSFKPNYVIHPEGSVLIECGKTRVLCNASIEDSVPPWMRNEEKPGGWITAEYSLLPRSTNTRVRRERNGAKGRTQEIQRLIGRSLRAGFDLTKLGPRTITVDCDVIQADGGTRTAAITGGYVALSLAINNLINNGELQPGVARTQIGAVSVGIVEGTAMLDLCYEEDSTAGVDANIVMNERGEFIEVQGTAEGEAFSREELDNLLELAKAGIKQLFAFQREVIKNQS